MNGIVYTYIRIFFRNAYMRRNAALLMRLRAE